jgi:serine/threonine protein kinase
MTEINKALGFPTEKRYESNFEELDHLGQGGFASVYHVRNKIDGIDYAMKKVVVSRENPEEVSKLLREAKYLSQINHSNVLRYYDCWIEEGIDVDGELLNSNEDSYQSSTSPASNRLMDISDDLDDGLVQFLDGEDCICEETGKLNLCLGKEPAPCYIIFIQTELCEGTLDTYLQNRNQLLQKLRKLPDQTEYTNAWARFIFEARIILRQLVEGLAHIHRTHSLVHRDLKPSNIFVNSKLQVKIGDFGLTKKVNQPPTLKSSKSLCVDEISVSHDLNALNLVKSKSTPENLESVTKNIGTLLYSSPEQIEGDVENFDHKSDIWSLALVILELFHPMTTTMEKHKTLNNCRKGVFPGDFEVAFPRIASILRLMLSSENSKRPTMEEMKFLLLQFSPRIQAEMKSTRTSAWKSRFICFDEECLYIYSTKNLNKAKFIYKLAETTFDLQVSEGSRVITAEHAILQGFVMKTTVPDSEALFSLLQKHM